MYVRTSTLVIASSFSYIYIYVFYTDVSCEMQCHVRTYQYHDDDVALLSLFKHEIQFHISHNCTCTYVNVDVFLIIFYDFSFVAA